MKTVFHQTKREAMLHLDELDKRGYKATFVDQEAMQTRYAVVYADKFCLNVTNTIAFGIVLVGLGMIVGLIVGGMGL